MRQELLELVRSVVKRDTVTLASGAVSDFYIDMRLLTLNARGAFLSANLIDSLLTGIEYDAIGGLTMGADPITGAYCYHAALKNVPVSGFIVRKEAKKHGLQKSIEGPELKAGARVVVVDDVVTSGGSLEIAIDALKNAGCRVVKALALVDREEGAGERMERLDIPFEAVFSKSEI